MGFRIKKLLKKHIKKEYVDTINHPQSKKYIEFSKKGNCQKTKKDLIDYLTKIPKDEFLYGVFKKNTHVANFKFQSINKRIFIGFLTLNRYQGKGIFNIIFPKIINLLKIKYPKVKKLYLGVDKKNYRAISLYKKLGFKFITKYSRIMNLSV